MDAQRCKGLVRSETGHRTPQSLAPPAGLSLIVCRVLWPIGHVGARTNRAPMHNLQIGICQHVLETCVVLVDTSHEHD